MQVIPVDVVALSLQERVCGSRRDRPALPSADWSHVSSKVRMTQIPDKDPEIRLGLSCDRAAMPAVIPLLRSVSLAGARSCRRMGRMYLLGTWYCSVTGHTSSRSMNCNPAGQSDCCRWLSSAQWTCCPGVARQCYSTASGTDGTGRK
jgi:hypothetical protein